VNKKDETTLKKKYIYHKNLDNPEQQKLTDYPEEGYCLL